MSILRLADKINKTYPASLKYIFLVALIFVSICKFILELKCVPGTDLLIFLIAAALIYWMKEEHKVSYGKDKDIKDNSQT